MEGVLEVARGGWGRGEVARGMMRGEGEGEGEEEEEEGHTQVDGGGGVLAFVAGW